MTRVRKRLIMEGPAAEAVERLSSEAGISPADLIRSALAREELARQQPVNPRDAAYRLRIAIRKMKAWADLNPSMVPLYQDFQRALAEIDGFIDSTKDPA